MRELAQWVFEVAPGETVNLRVVARESEARYVGVWLDSNKLVAPEDLYQYRIYSFTVSKPVGQTHVVQLECNFSTNAPATAAYDLWLSGSFDKGEFLRTVRQPDPNRDIDIVFAVAQPASQRVKEDEALPRDGRVKGADQERPKGWTRAKPPQKIADEKSVDTPGITPGAPSEGPPEEMPRSGPVRAEKSPPERRPEARPEIVAEIAPEVRAEIRPEVVPEVAPTLQPPAPPKAPRPTRRRALAGTPKLPKRRPVKERIVNLGFASEATPRKPVAREKPLTSGRTYYFWLEVGPGVLPGSLEADKPVTLPTEQLPVNAVLKVVLFGFQDELKIQAGADVGELELQADGSVLVKRHAFQPQGVDVDTLSRRLFFPVDTPKREGAFRLRCSIYYRNLLIQSRLVRARVMKRRRVMKQALKSTVDYTLSRSLDPARLTGIEEHRLSLMLNDNGGGVIGLRVFGEDIKDDVPFDGHELQDLIKQARAGLRQAAWGDTEPWNQQKEYRYGGPRNFDRLRGDLIRLAKNGYAFYHHIIERFSGGLEQTKALADKMKQPGPVQVALKQSARHVIPAALIYDYVLDDGLNDDEFNICPSFKKAFDDKAALDQVECFNGACPSRNDKGTVCPSGFWGYRHYIGLPLSLAKAPDAPTEITCEGAPSMTVAVATDLELRGAHEKVLKALRPGLGWSYADTRAAAFKLLKEAKAHLVYFYCHGGLKDNKPYLRVGPPKTSRITAANLRAYEIKWEEPRPLVFINGCHTTALEPEQALEFVTSFITLANASGVIGTEITVFEPLAQKFAEECLRRFIVEGKNIGESVRAARLALLRDGNPLGLVYVPYVMTSLHMVQR